MTIKDLIHKDNKVRFLYYRKGELWYSVVEPDFSDVGALNGHVFYAEIFRFPVPVSDCGDGQFLAEDRAITFMRYIRQQLEACKLEEQSTGNY